MHGRSGAWSRTRRSRENRALALRRLADGNHTAEKGERALGDFIELHADTAFRLSDDDSPQLDRDALVGIAQDKADVALCSDVERFSGLEEGAVEAEVARRSLDDPSAFGGDPHLHPAGDAHVSASVVGLQVFFHANWVTCPKSSSLAVPRRGASPCIGRGMGGS
jgi:hypothetical protein